MSNKIFFYYLQFENALLCIHIPNEQPVRMGRFNGMHYYVTSNIEDMLCSGKTLVDINTQCSDYIDMIYTVNDQIRDYCKQTNQTMVPHYPEDPFNHRETIIMEHEGIPIVEVRAYDLACYGWSDKEKQKLRSEKLKEATEIFETINRGDM